MITAIKADSKNIEAYKALYDEASDILRGYKRVRTYNNEETYYRRNDDATRAEDLYVALNINSLSEFSSALAARGFLYIKHVNEKGEWLRQEEFDPMHKITTLEEYFSWLRNLGDTDKKYTMLPLDEPHFTIDTDTRAISIPAAFKKNGIAVQGDDLAEIVYFKVDRYYDYMDLNNTDIYIQWEAPKDPKDPKSETIKGLSPAYIRDISSEPGKLIFGWAISEALTQNSGLLKFAVRFFQWTNEENAKNNGETILAYSLSTLTATVSVQPGLNFDLEVNPPAVDDAGNRIIGRLKNSIIAGGYAAAAPIFKLNLDDSVYDDLDKEDNTHEIFVQAYATDTGAISYAWRKQGLNPDNTTTDQNIDPLLGTNVYIPVEDYANLDRSYAYYWVTGSDENGNKIYNLYPNFIIDDTDGSITPHPDDTSKEGFALYVKQSKLTVDSAGVYYAIAENRITNSTTTTESKHIVFPWPEDVRIVEQPAAAKTLIELDDGSFEEFLNVQVDNTDGVLTYQWEKDDNYGVSFNSDEAVFTPVPDANGGKTEKLKVTEPGRYRVTIVNTRNLESHDEVSAISRVTKKPELPIYEIEGANQFLISQLSETNSPTIVLDSSVESDYYNVVWYLFENNKHYAIASQDIPHGETKATLNLANPEIINTIKNMESDDPEFDRDLDGAYYPIVTNFVNGESKSTDIPTDVNNDMFWVNK